MLKTKTAEGAPPAPKTQRHVTAGPQALAAMARLLGLQPGGQGWQLEGLCAQGSKNIRLSLRSGLYRLIILLLPPQDPTAIARAGRLALGVEGEPPAGAVKKILASLAARLAGQDLPGLLRTIEADPRSFREEITLGQKGDRIQVPCVGQPITLLESGWRNFFADQDFEVLLGVPECSPKGTVTIQYCDMECYYARPRRSFRKWNFLDWPEVGLDEKPRKDGESDSLIVTELEERDMILGTGERADRLVQEAKRVAAQGKYLIFTHLCTPIIMGEDFQGLARRCEKEIGGTSVSWSQKDRDENNNFGEHLKSLLGRPGFFKGSGSSTKVNLFHFPVGYRDEELKPFLESIGIKVNVCVFPEVEFPALEELPKAVWQVFCERSSYPSRAREMLAASPRKVLNTPAPYGLERTRQCLQAIAAATGKGRAFQAAWRRKMAGFLPSWEQMKKEAAGRRLAFVVSAATLPRLLELRYGHGAPLAVMVQEMGFGVDLVYYDLHGEAPELPEGLRAARVTVFRSPWELEQALRQGQFQAVFSDIFFDWRISRAGKARFSSKDFEMGLEGSRRTLQRLLSLCRLPFYKRYGEHLARGAGGRNVR